MRTLLVNYPLLSLFLVVGGGAALGALRVGRLRLGAAGALFVGLAVSAAWPGAAHGFEVVQQLGLALFVYTVGLASGATFMSGVRRNAPLMLAAGVASFAGALVAGFGGRALGLPGALSTGLFTGALTAAPALDAATRLTGGVEAAVGYSAGYPFGVVVGIVAVTIVAVLPWRGPKDAVSLTDRGLHAVTVKVGRGVNPRQIAAWRDQLIRFSYLHREGRTRVLVPGEDLRPDDLVVLVGDEGEVDGVVSEIGEVSPEHLADDRSVVQFERIVLSNPDLPGRSVAELNLPARFGALVTRVGRGDLDLLARDDLYLQSGDSLAVVVPGETLADVREFLGDSHTQATEVDALSLGVGLVLGVLAGLISLPLPGGQVFQLGLAAGPLVVGMLLGALRRTGPLVWSMPVAVNLTLRQVGLLLFLAALGLSAGPDVGALLGSSLGWKSALLSLGVALVGVAVVAVWGFFAGLSAPRTAGGIAGFLGQPAVLQSADSRVRDERVEGAYSALFAVAILVKILLVPLVWSV